MPGRGSSWRVALACVTCCVFPAASAEAGPTQDRVFNPECVAEINLTAPAQSITNLYADPKGAYQPATMTFDVCGNGTEVYGPLNVTFRLKGNGSFRTLDGKAAFKVKMPSGNRIDGLKSFTLNNMVQDASSMHEALAYEVYRAIGVAAPRTGYATVYVNGLDYGLHANVETLDDRFLASKFASTQHLYESPDWPLYPRPTKRDILPQNVANYQLEEGSAASRSDLEALAAISQIEDNDQWWVAFHQHFNAERVLRFWAAETLIGDFDDFTSGVNNFYLRSDADGVFEFLPWGRDNSFTKIRTLVPDSSASVVAGRCFKYTICRDDFRAARGFVANKLFGLDLVGRAHRIEAAIVEAVRSDSRREFEAAEQCAAANATIAFLAKRAEQWAAFPEADPAELAKQGAAQLDCPSESPTGPTGVPTGPTGVPPTGPADSAPASPAKKFTVSINSADRRTSTRRVTLSLDWPATGVSAAQIANSPAFSRARTLPPRRKIGWTLAKSGAGSIRKVYVRFLAVDGSALATATDAIRIVSSR